MEDKLIIDEEMFNSLAEMMMSADEATVITAVGILDNIDEWEKQNQEYKEQLFEIYRGNKHIKEKNNLLLKVWISKYGYNE